MKKLLLFSAILVGGMAASQAGVSFNIGFGLPALPHVVVSRPAWSGYEAAPVVTAAPACEPVAPVAEQSYCPPAPVVVAPAPYCAPGVEVDRRPVIVNERYAYNARTYSSTWDRAQRGHGEHHNNRHDYGRSSHDHDRR